MMDEGRLRTELRRDPATTPPIDLERVVRRARVLRIRRRIAGAVAVVAFGAIVAVPISGLVRLGTSPGVVASPDGSFLAFAPVEGFTVYSSEGELPDGGGQSALASNVPLVSSDGMAQDGRLTAMVRPFDTLETMSPDGVVILAWSWTDGANPMLPTTVLPARDLPLDLADARKDRAWEGQPNQNVPQYLIWSTVNGRRLDVRVYFGRLDPTPEQLAAAQRLLDGLVVPPPPPTTDAIDQFGISLAMPDGWHGRLSRFSPSDPPVLEASTVPFDGWTDGVPTDDLGAGDVSFWLAENDGLDVGYERISLPVTIDDTDRCDECPAVGESDPAASPGHAFFFRTFEVAGRSFELSVEFGSDAPTPEEIAGVNAALSGLAIDGSTVGPTTETIGAEGISLEVPSDWHSSASEVANGVRPFLATSNVPLPEPGADGLPADDLGTDDVLVTVSGYPNGSLEDFPAVADVPLLEREEQLCSGCEGPTPPAHLLWTPQFTLDGHHLYLRVEFGGPPSPERFAAVAAVIASLSAAPPTTAQTVTTGGVTLEIPSDWHWDTSPYGGTDEHLEVSSVPIVFGDRQDLAQDDITINVFANHTGATPRYEPWDGTPLRVERDDLCFGDCEEGSPGDTSLWWATISVDDQPITVRVDFGGDPSDQAIARANEVLSSLAIGTISPPRELHATTEDARFDDPLSGISFDVPSGWWAKADAVPNLLPPVLAAFGNSDFERGGECGPTPALAELPADGALAWIWEPPSPPGNAGDYAPWPPHVSLDAATPSNYECSGDTPVRRFTYSLAGRFFVVQVALGDQAPDEVRTLVEDALSSFEADPR